MAIPDSLIEEVRQKADIVEVVAEYTRLKRSGKTFRGPCPLHGGSGPNFSVDPAQGFFKCFVCGEGGDLFTFLMKQEGMNFQEAVRAVAERVGVEIPERGEAERAPEPHAALHSANAFAAEWFRKQLWGEAGEVARAYLEKRGVSREAAERFGLGWAPEAWSAFGDEARRQAIPEETLLSLGLVKQSSKGRSAYDAFRGRLIFPIEDLGGRVIAFGGRILGQAAEHVPKYLNSPETPVYRKGEQLYGLSWSRGPIRKAEAALLVEGYMDYVSLAAHGVENVVAGLGTALTGEQAGLLARYTKRAILLYDSDRAGLKATFRSGDELLRHGVAVMVATLPPGEDPDSLVRGEGPKALQRYLDDAIDVLERKILILEQRGYFGNISETRRAIDALLPTVRAASDEVLSGIYLTRIAERSGVPRETLEREAASTAPEEARGAPGHERRTANPGRRASDRAPEAAPTAAALGPERNLLKVLLRDDAYVERALREIGPEDFRDPLYRAVFEGLLQIEGEHDPAGEWLRAFPPEAIPLVEELRGDPEVGQSDSVAGFFDDNVRRLLARRFEDRLIEINRALQALPVEEQMPLLVELRQMKQEVMARHLPVKPGLFRGMQGNRRADRDDG